jgi:hypothetical protein
LTGFLAGDRLIPLYKRGEFMKKLSSFLSALLVSFCLTTVFAAELPAKFILPSAEAAMLSDFAFSPDNQTIAVRGPTYIQLWNISTQTLIKTISNLREVPPNAAIKQLQFSPDGKYLLERFYDAPHVVVTDVETEKVVFEKTVTGEKPYNSIYRFSPSGEALLVFDDKAGTADLIDVKTWKTTSTTFIGISPYYAAYYMSFLFTDEDNILVQYHDDSNHDFKLLKYKLGTTEVTQLEVPIKLSYMVQLSPTKYVARTSIGSSNYDASVFDLTDNSVTKFYDNAFYPPDDANKPVGASIGELEYNAQNDMLLIGTTTFPNQLPKGLRLIDMKTMKASPSFDFHYMETVHLYANDKENYLVGLNDGAKYPEEAGVLFLKVGQL